jgi:hypothetical protein
MRILLRIRNPESHTVDADLKTRLFCVAEQKFCLQDDAGHGPLQPPEGTLQQDEQLPDALHCQAGEQQSLPLPGKVTHICIVPVLYCAVTVLHCTVLYLCCAALYCTVLY